MILIGERINAGFKDIKKAVQEKDGSNSVQLRQDREWV